MHICMCIYIYIYICQQTPAVPRQEAKPSELRGLHAPERFGWGRDYFVYNSMYMIIISSSSSSNSSSSSSSREAKLT